MATDKPRFSITVSDDIYQQINEYQHEHRLATQTKAVLVFIEKGLEVVQKEKKSPTGFIEVEPFQTRQKEQELSLLADFDDNPVETKNSPSTTEAAPGDDLRSILIRNFDQLNQEGQERLVETSDDMVSSGKYIKNNEDQLDKAHGA